MRAFYLVLTTLLLISLGLLEVATFPCPSVRRRRRARSATTMRGNRTRSAATMGCVDRVSERLFAATVSH